MNYIEITKLLRAYKRGSISKKLALEIAEEKDFNLIIDEVSDK